MTTIAEENRKALRQAMVVRCGFQETNDTPTSQTPTGNLAVFDGLANLDPAFLTTVLMDLAGSGFLNDGNAQPMQTDTDSFRYGYISDGPALSDGTFLLPFGVVIEAANDWDVVTLEVVGQYGERKVVQVNPIWINGQTTVLIDRWTAGQRAYITGVYLGMAWLWDNSNLIGVNLDLHSVNTELAGELEISSVEIQAYEPTDYTSIIGRIPKGAPIWYSAGYIGDMSARRDFYMEEISWDDNILTVRGQDASTLLEGVEVPIDALNYAGAWNVDLTIIKRVRTALSPITYTEEGSISGLYIDSQDIVYDAKAARSIISEYTGLFRDENGLRITYVDAGIPTLWIGQNGSSWTIYADEIADMNIVVEHNKNEIKIVLPEYYLQWNGSIQDINATAGKSYLVQLENPIPGSNYYFTPTPTSSEKITPSVIKFKAAATTNYTIYGYEMMSELAAGNNPYTASVPEAGETYTFDFEMPLFISSGNSLTKQAVTNLLNRSNILYEFTYRGNPHIQPRDVLNVEVATWLTELVTIDGLYPAEDLYPRADLYPYAVYKEQRKMETEWVGMTVDTVTLEHADGGGLTSTIRARKGAV